MSAATLPWPLVKPWRHPVRWTLNKIQLLVSAGVLAYVGMLIIVAVYYLLWETTPTMKHLWDDVLVPNSDLRHNIRNIGETLLGGILAQSIVWNHFKKKVRKKPSLIDKLEIKLHIPNPKDGRPFSVVQLVLVVPLILLYATPGFIVGYELVHVFHHAHTIAVTYGLTKATTPVAVTHSSIGLRMEQLWTQDWPKKLIGFGASFFFGRRPARGVMDDVQLLFAQRRVQLYTDHKTSTLTRWYHSPTFQARVNSVWKEPSSNLVVHDKLLKRVVILFVPIGLGLAVFGWYVLAYIAK